MSTEEKVTMLTGACEKLEADLTAADAKIASMQSDYDHKALERLASGDAKSARTARQQIAEAQAAADDLRTGLIQTREYLRAAQAEMAAEAEATAWNAAEASMDAFVGGMGKLQADTSAMIESFLAIQPLAAAMLRQAPRRGRVEFVEHQLVHDLMLFIAANGGQRLGRLGARTVIDPSWLRSQPDLVGKAKAMKIELLSHRNAIKAADGGAAA